jgi:hypothetical protein
VLNINKRGAEKNEMAMFSLIGTVFLLMFALFWTVAPMLDNYYILTDFKIQDLRYDVRVMTVINSADCLAFEDAFGGVHPATLDLNKLSGDNEEDIAFIRGCSSLGFNLNKKVSNFNFELTDSLGSQVSAFGANVPKDVVYNKDLLVRYVENGDTKTGLLEVNVWI